MIRISYSRNKMDENHIKILDWYEKELLLSLNLQTLLTPLLKETLITRYEKENLEKLIEADWKSETQTSAKTAKKKFLEILKSKGPNAYSKFLNILRIEKEHSGHKSLYEKLVEHEGGTLPRCDSQPVGSVTEKMIVSSVSSPNIRRKSLKPNTTGFGSVSEDGLEQISERLASLESAFKSLEARISEKNNVSLTTSYAVAGKAGEHRTSEMAGLPTQSITHLKVSCITYIRTYIRIICMYVCLYHMILKLPHVVAT